MGKKNHKSLPFMCGQCKSGFVNEAAVRNHIKSAHPRIHKCGIYKSIATVDGPEYDPTPSIADQMIEAELNRAMGVNSGDDWLLPWPTSLALAGPCSPSSPIFALSGLSWLRRNRNQQRK